MITNTHRSTRHGEDGIHDEDGFLQCRMSDVAFNILPTETSTKPMFPKHGAIPVECEKLAHELSYHASILNNTQTRQEFEDIERLVSGENLDQKQSLSKDHFYTIFMNHIRSPVATMYGNKLGFHCLLNAHLNWLNFQRMILNSWIWIMKLSQIFGPQSETEKNKYRGIQLIKFYHFLQKQVPYCLNKLILTQ